MRLQSQSQHQDWWETLKETFSFENLRKHFDFSSKNFVEISASFALGFISSFFLKKYGRYIIAIFVFALLSIWLFSHFNVITIDWAQVRSMVGISQAQTLEGLWTLYTAWIKQHSVAVIAFVVGFLLGYSVG